MKVRMLVAAAAVVFGASYAQAEGDSGCGLGSMIIQENTKVMQVLAYTTNSTTQPFGISTGTSNCRSQQIVRNDKAIQYFAEANQSDLSREMAQGQGEKLQTLAALYGCQGDAQRTFASKAQASYSSIVPSADVTATQMVQNMNSQLAGTCSAM